MTSLARRWSVLADLGSLSARTRLSYGTWFWVNLFVQGLTLVVVAAFWRAVFAGRSDVAGLNLQQGLSYALLARMLTPLSDPGLIGFLGQLVRSGDLANELLRPVDFQSSAAARALGLMAVDFLTRLPVVIPLALLLGLQLPASPAPSLAALAVTLLGLINVFLFEWTLACVAFYTSYVWGLSMLRGGLIAFFSGSLLPLAFMPGGLRAVALTLPHTQVVALPAALLSGQTPIGEVPRVLLTQLLALAVLYPLSRWVFTRAVQRVTVQGG